VFNSPADIGGRFTEIIAPGAFAAALGADVRALIDHDPGRVIGRSKAGTLRLSEDAIGLVVEIDLPDTSDGRDLAVSIERGDISGMSFAFKSTKENWDETDPKKPKRIILGLDLRDVSVVAFPAYPDTSVALRSLADARKAQRVTNHLSAIRRIQRKAETEARIRGLK